MIEDTARPYAFKRTIWALGTGLCWETLCKIRSAALFDGAHARTLALGKFFSTCIRYKKRPCLPLVASNILPLWTTHAKISQAVPGLLPEKYLNNIVVIREQHCWSNNIVPSIVVSTIFFILVSTILFSNDEATRLFIAVGNSENMHRLNKHVYSHAFFNLLKCPWDKIWAFCPAVSLLQNNYYVKIISVHIYKTELTTNVLSNVIHVPKLPKLVPPLLKTCS